MWSFELQAISDSDEGVPRIEVCFSLGFRDLGVIRGLGLGLGFYEGLGFRVWVVGFGFWAF